MLKLLALAGLLLGAAPVAAQPPAQQPAPAISFDDQPAAAADKDSKRVICQTEKQIGSRLASKKICMTASQWKEREQQVRGQLDQMHSQPQNAGGPG